tara:strand:- start:93 stop:389 length:297 start_codon:yes stop_codon:yes gene_type:complete
MTNIDNNEDPLLADSFDGLLLADGLGDALVGTCSRAGGMGPVALYDSDKCIEILMKIDGMDYEEAVEFFDFNIQGAWVGDQTPVFANILVIPVALKRP